MNFENENGQKTVVKSQPLMPKIFEKDIKKDFEILSWHQIIDINLKKHIGDYSNPNQEMTLEIKNDSNLDPF